MSVQHSYIGKKALVLGAGRSGTAAARFLLTCGAQVVLSDIRSKETLIAEVASLEENAQHTGKLVLELGGHRAASFGNCDFVVVSPGVPLSLPYFEISRKAGIPIMAEVELACRHLRGKILGITGSNGKTTTTTLVSELLNGSGLKGHAAGNIGIPLIGLVSDSTPADIYATELSSFQLESIQQFRPFVASILNLTPDHLDRYSLFEDYIAAKQRIFMNQDKTDYAVLNADDARTAAIAACVPSKPVLFSHRKVRDCGAFVRNGRVIFRNREGEKELFAVTQIGLKGEHNLENVLAACAIAILAGAAPESLEEVIRSFKGVEHRLEWVAEINGVDYFNDSKATNVEAAIVSLRAFAGNILLISGGRDKGGDFTKLRPLVRQRVKHLFLIGEAAGKIREALSEVVEISEVKSLPEAVETGKRLAHDGDVVLLSPACASFDMFQNFEHRGLVFKQAVHSLKSLGSQNHGL